MVEATDSVVCLHATLPATVYLSAWARTEGMAISDMERALYGERSLVKHLAMRRTLFAFPRETLPFAQAGASNRVAGLERRRLIRDVERAGLHRDGERWLEDACRQVLALLSDGREASLNELRSELPVLEGSIAQGMGRSWGGQAPVGPRVLNILAAAGQVVRASNDGAWTISRPRWALMKSWLREEIAPPREDQGVGRLVELWLEAFGPGTLADIRWWLGSTVGAVRRALGDLGAVEVRLGSQTGYVLPDDLEEMGPLEPWAALLPPLDPTTMGWLERDWYLGPHRDQLFDRNGNAGPTVWWDGRVVGGWRQDDLMEVELQLLEDVGADGLRGLEQEAERLSSWLDGRRVVSRALSPLSSR